MTTDLGFVHVYQPPAAAGAPILLLLHGTGGDEHDLLPLAPLIAPNAGVLSPRGKVLERGMPRFFKRLAHGVFDLEDLRLRTEELATFVAAAAAHYGFARHDVVAVGFSNGANIAASLLLLHPTTLARAVLFSAMPPIEPEAPPDLRGVSVYMTGGRRDTMIEPEQTQRLATLLQEAGAAVTLRWNSGGHEITRDDIDGSREWLRGLMPDGGRP
jgi:phospholipase/carboxylesterase/glyoxalase family protein